MQHWRLLGVAGAWAAAQAGWLATAGALEFGGHRVFSAVYLASLALLVAHAALVRGLRVRRNRRTRLECAALCARVCVRASD